jgi:hypothetical protein
MDMFKVTLDNNREYQVVAIEPALTQEDAFHIMRRIVFDWEQKKLASELATKITPNAEYAERIRKRLSDRKSDS